MSEVAEPVAVRPGVQARPEWPAPVLLGAMAGSLVAGRFETALLCVSAAAVSAAVAGAPWPSRAWVMAVAIGVALAVLLNLYLTPGRALGGLRVFGWPPTDAGLRHGALLALRLVGASTAIHGLRAAWPGERGADELARLLRPLEWVRVPVREARVILGLALRFVPLLVREAKRIARLQDLRAGRHPRGLGERLERFRAALVPTLVAALERAEHTALALEARHYRVRAIPAGSGRLSMGALAGLALAGASLLWRA